MTHAGLPPATAIICSRNRRELLRDCVDLVLRGDEVPRELIIVDDSDSADPVLRALVTDRPCEVRYCWRHAKGLSSAMNFAIREARHDVLVFTQDDAEVDASWLAKIVRSLSEAGPRTIVTGQVQAGTAEMPGGFVANVNIRPERMTYRGRVDRDVLYAQNMAMYRADAMEIGAFDERLGPGTPFPGSEDSDFAFRALEAGCAIVYDPTVVVRHRAWREEQQYARFRFGYGFARGGFYAKYIRVGGDRFMLGRLWRDVWRHLAPLPRLILRDRRRALGHSALAFGVLAGAARWKVDAVRDRGGWRTRRDPIRGRRRALREEVGYWRQWLATRGGKWPEEYTFRFGPSSEVADPILRAVIAGVPHETVSVIDVGSGPASMVGYVLPGKNLALVAVDPLADEYNRLLDESGVAPPVRPIRAEGEHLFETFGPDRFDVAYSRNALDHAVDPSRIIENMVGILRPGGYVVLRHMRNEGVRQAYVELHQWNFDTRDDHLIAWRPGVEVDITARLAGRAEVECRVEHADNAEHAEVVAVIRKIEFTP